MAATSNTIPEGVSTGWVQVLERLESDLAVLDEILDEGEVAPLQTWVPPGDLGAVPADLRERADELRLRLGRAQERAQERLAALAGELHEVHRQRRAGEAYARSG